MKGFTAADGEGLLKSLPSHLAHARAALVFTSSTSSPTAHRDATS